MRRLPGLALLILLLGFLTATSAFAQIYFPPIFYPPFGYPRPNPGPHDPPPDPKDAPVEIGGYAAVGGMVEETPPPYSGSFSGSAGIYAQWNRFGFCPGVDLRIQGNANDLHGYLVGPRVAYQPKGHLRPFRLYAEGLFGKNEITYYPSTAVFTGPAIDRVGVNRSIVVGLDLHTDESLFGWRVIEFSKGGFTGLAGSHPQTIMTGIVFHFP